MKSCVNLLFPFAYDKMEVGYIAEGTLVIQCFEKDKNISDVHICIRDDRKTVPIVDIKTGVDGKTEKIQLQTPEKEKSFQQGQCPYGIFHIECSKTGYACACFKNVQIFPGVNSYLRVDMKKDDKGSKDEIIFPHHHLFVEDNNA